MTASQRQACSDSAEDKRVCFMGPRRHWLHCSPTCVVNLRPIAVGLQTVKWHVINQWTRAIWSQQKGLGWGNSLTKKKKKRLLFKSMEEATIAKELWQKITALLV